MTLIAKGDGETLLAHSKLVYEYGMQVIENLALELGEIDRLKELSILPLFFHDIGKGALGFQEALDKSTSWKGCRHEILSTAFLSQFKLCDEQLFAVITHHKDIANEKVRRKLPREQIETFDGDTGVLKQMKESFNANEKDIASFCSEVFKLISSDAQFEVKLKEGLGINDDWIMYSSKRKYKRKIQPGRRILATKLRGVLRTADHLASAHVSPSKPIELKKYQYLKISTKKLSREMLYNKR